MKSALTMYKWSNLNFWLLSGTYVWRIEQFIVTEVPKNMVGKFYDGDAYIVLHVR